MAERAFSIIGHRGAAACAPENTAASLRAGLAAGADAIEVDVCACSDGRVVLLHDLTLDRTTSGRGPLHGLPWDRVAGLDAGTWFSSRFAGEPPIDLDAALAIARARVPLVIEVKHKDEACDAATLAGVLDALARTGGTKGIVLSSAHWPLLEMVPALRRALTVSLRAKDDPFAWASRIGAVELHVNRRLCSPAFVARARASGLRVLAYTVNRASELAPLLAAGVDGAFSDDPAGLRRALERARPGVPPGPLTLGIDQGSGGTRAVLADAEGRIVASRAVPVASRRTKDGGRVQDAEALAASVARAASPLLARTPVAAAGLTTQRSSLVVWMREHGRARLPVRSWRAGASDEQEALRPWRDREEEVRRTTGLPARFPYAGVRLSALLARDRALAGEAAAGALCAGSVGDFLVARLTGRSGGAGDPSLAQRTLLWDLERGRFDPELARRAGIPERVLPAVTRSLADRGRARVGTERPRLLALCGDTGAAVRAVAGRTAEGGVLVLGTGGFLVVGTGSERIEVPGLLTTLLWEDAQGPRYAIEGTVHGVAASLAEAARRTGLEGLPLDLLTARAGAARRAPRVLTAPEGLGTPQWDPSARFEIEPGEWSADEVVRGTLEGIAERFGEIGDLLREAERVPDRFVATGGCALPHLVAAIAARLRLPVAIDSAPDRTACGAALLAHGALEEEARGSLASA
jgi:glycerol kinase/glycerophosphoryl diester phosphodiesterase